MVRLLAAAMLDRVRVTMLLRGVLALEGIPVPSPA